MTGRESQPSEHGMSWSTISTLTCRHWRGDSSLTSLQNRSNRARQYPGIRNRSILIRAYHRPLQGGLDGGEAGLRLAGIGSNEFGAFRRIDDKMKKLVCLWFGRTELDFLP